MQTNLNLSSISAEVINYTKFKKITTSTISFYEVLACLVIEKGEKNTISSINKTINFLIEKPKDYYVLLNNTKLDSTNLNKISFMATTYKNTKKELDYTYLIKTYGAAKVFKTFATTDAFIQICKHNCINN